MWSDIIIYVDGKNPFNPNFPQPASIMSLCDVDPANLISCLPTLCVDYFVLFQDLFASIHIPNQPTIQPPNQRTNHTHPFTRMPLNFLSVIDFLLKGEADPVLFEYVSTMVTNRQTMEEISNDLADYFGEAECKQFIDDLQV